MSRLIVRCKTYAVVTVPIKKESQWLVRGSLPPTRRLTSYSVFWFNNRKESPEHNQKSIKVVIILKAIRKKDGTGREALKGGI
jgi:hypothetical protein